MLFLCLRDWPWAPLYVFCCDKLFMQVVVIVLLYVSDVLVVTACMCLFVWCDCLCNAVVVWTYLLVGHAMSLVDESQCCWECVHLVLVATPVYIMTS